MNEEENVKISKSKDTFAVKGEVVDEMEYQNDEESTDASTIKEEVINKIDGQSNVESIDTSVHEEVVDYMEDESDLEIDKLNLEQGESSNNSSSVSNEKDITFDKTERKREQHRIRRKRYLNKSAEAKESMQEQRRIRPKCYRNRKKAAIEEEEDS